MLLRQIPRIQRVSVSRSTTTINSHQKVYASPNVSDPDPPHSEDPSTSRSISLATSDNGRTNTTQSGSDPPGSNESFSNEYFNPPQPSTQIISAKQAHPSTSSHTNPPFHTHKFFTELERTFPTPIARSLMRATKALLVDRVGRVRREGLTIKDLENQAYLFRAALSELRAEVTMRTRNDSAAIRAATTALRRDVDKVDVKMKEDLTTLKHEIQMELDSRKNESRTDMKKQDIIIEELMNKAIVELGDLRTDMESVKWDNMRKSVAALSAFVLVILLTLELRFKSHSLPSPPRPPTQPEVEDLESMNWVT